MIDERSRESLALFVGCKLKSDDALYVLSDLYLRVGQLEYIHSDNSTGFTGGTVKTWLAGLRIKPACINPGSSWENGLKDGFNGRL